MVYSWASLTALVCCGCHIWDSWLDGDDKPQQNLHNKIAYLTAYEKKKVEVNFLGCDPYMVPTVLLARFKSADNLLCFCFVDIYIVIFLLLSCICLVYNPSP